MTLNAIINRIRAITIAHDQIREFARGNATDFFAGKTALYAAACLEDNGGGFDLGTKTLTIAFRLWLLDLVHVSNDTKENELDVQSDMLSVALDLIAEFAHDQYSDWRVEPSNPVTFVTEHENDMLAGVVVDFSISTIYARDVCAVPSDVFDIINQEQDTKVFDEVYIATGAEGSTLTIPAIAGKRVVLVTRGNNILYPTNSAPASYEYVFDGSTIELGAGTIASERFLVLYRNYN